MDSRAVSPSYLQDYFRRPSRELETYLEGIQFYLKGGTLSEPQLKALSDPYRLLLSARGEIQIRRWNGPFIDALQGTAFLKNSFFEAERQFVLGYYCYSRGDYTNGSFHYRRASELFREQELPTRELLCRFNWAQCLEKMGNVDEAAGIELEILERADHLGLYQVQGSVRRSMGYRALLGRDFDGAIRLLDEAERCYFALGNFSDAAVTHLYVELIRKFEAQKSFSRLAFLEKYKRVPDARVERFIQLLEADPASAAFADRYGSADDDIRDAVKCLTERSPKKVPLRLRARPKRNQNLALQLLEFLGSRGSAGATAEECQGKLWATERTSAVYLNKRLWTLVYRINRASRKIVMGPDHRYRLT